MIENAPIVIGGTSIKAGERADVKIPVADLYTGTSLSMQVRVVRGRRPGPVLFVSAAVHGDELNGVEIIRRLLKRKSLNSLRGTLLAVPIVNVHGFLNQSRYLPDRRDLNRCFPGSPKGSIAARLANTFLSEIVAKSDVGLDLHTGAVNRSNLPQIRADLGDAQTRDIAMVFGAPVIVDSAVREGSLRACASDLDMPILVYEAGEALRFDELGIRAGLRGTINVMQKIGMLPPNKKPKSINTIEAKSTSWVRAQTSGILNRSVKLGATVTKSQTIATVTNPLGNEESTLIAPFDGIVIGCTNLPLVHEGDAVFNVASFSSISKAEEMVEEFAASHDVQ